MAAGSPCVPLPDPDPGWETGLGGMGSRGTRARGADTPEHSCPRSPRTTTAPSAAGEGSGDNPLEVLLWCQKGHVAWLGRTEPGEPDADQQVPQGPQGPGAIQGHVHLPACSPGNSSGKTTPGSAGQPPEQVPADSRASVETHGQKPGSAGCAPLVWGCRMRQQGREAGVPDPAQALLGVSIPEHSPALLLCLFISAAGTSKLYDFLDRVCPSYVYPLLFSEPQPGVLRAGVCPAHAL